MDRTEAVGYEEVEGMAIAVVGELVVGSRKFLETLRSDACEIPGELSVFCKNHGSSCYKTVDQILLPHFPFFFFFFRSL